MAKKITSLLLAALLFFSLAPMTLAATPADFRDMPAESHWSYEALSSAIANGLLNGSGGKLFPESNLTRAEMAAIVNRAFGATATADISAFRDVKTTDWFYTDVAKAVRMGTFNGSGGGKMEPDDPILREQAFTVVWRALKLEPGDASALSKFSDASKISDYAKGPIAALAAAGYVNGSGGRVNPTDTITREEFAQVFHNVIKKYVRTAGEVTGDVKGNVIVNAPGAILTGMKIDGDLIVGEGVGDGEIVLDAVEVTGRVVVRGGGENSVIIKNGSTVGSIVIGKTGDGGVRVRTEEGCRVEVVTVDDGVDEIILEGELNQVRIDTDTPVVIRDASVIGLTVSASGADVTVEGDSNVIAAEIREAASGAALTVGKEAGIGDLTSYAESAVVAGEGKIATASVSGDNTRFDIGGTQLTVAAGTEGVSENGEAVAGGSSVLTGGEPPHVHTWGEGVVTREPSCTEPGVRTFTCECGETRTEEIPAPGHDWDEGVETREATREEDGIITFTCRRCGATREEPVSYAPYVVLATDGEGHYEPVFCRTLDEAIAEASKYPTHNEPGEPEWTEHVPINLFGADVIDNVSIPAGYTLTVTGDLALSGSISLGSSDYSFCPGCGAGRIQVMLKGDTTFSVNGVTYFDGDGAEDGLFTTNGGEDSLALLTISGMRAVDKSDDPDDEYLFAKPWFCFEIARGDRIDYTINGDFDLSDSFGGLLVENGVGKVFVKGRLDISEFNLWDGEVVFTGDDAALTVFGRKIAGTTDEYLYHVTEKGDDGEWFSFLPDGSAITAKAVTMTDDAEAWNIELRGTEEEGLDFTVADGVILTVGHNVMFGEKVRIINDGLISVRGRESFVFGSLLNRGVLRLEVGEASYGGDSSLIFEEGSLLRNEGAIMIGASADENGWRRSRLTVNGTFENAEGAVVDDRGELGFFRATVTNDGLIVNGSLTGTGEGFDGGRSDLSAEDSSIENRGRIVNNGQMFFNRAGYSQTADAKFETYNSSGFEVWGGALAVPSGSEFYNEGYMRITDDYGGEGFRCDLSAFEDFFTVWNTEGNDSHWCDFNADVSTTEGYAEAVAEQAKRPDNMKYNRMTFRDDITFAEDVTFEGFDGYWLENKSVVRYVRWTDDGPVETDPTDPEAHEDYRSAGVAVTVADGATLTVAGGSTVIVTGADREFDDFSSVLAVRGKLVIERGTEEERNEDGEVTVPWRPDGRIEIWEDGSFDAEGGEVDCGGFFEVRYMEANREENGETVWEGTFCRPEHTVLRGLPEEAQFTAEARSEAGFVLAATSEDPLFTGIRVRNDTTIALRGDVTVRLGVTVDIEGASGLIVEHGATLTISGGSTFFNNGDVTVWGDLTIDGFFINNQSLEIGAVTGSEKATVTVNGRFENNDRVAVYATGAIVIGGDFENRRDPIDVTVLSGPHNAPEVSGARVLGPVTLTNEGGEGPGHFHNCEFTGDVTVVCYDGEDRFDLDFGVCRFSDGVRILMKYVGYEGDGYNMEGFGIGNDEVWYWLEPHIFSLGDDPSVFIGVCDENIRFGLTLDGQPLEFRTDLIPEDNKTHLNSPDEGLWFTAEKDNAPDLELTVSIPDLPTIVFDRVPLKPEWEWD
ncbi:MAG: S-layer homology domain-containing protein [Clostridia bacterium]|nr:S-layer homology domain-containing protein [Clostridia bacterium]